MTEIDRRHLLAGAGALAGLALLPPPVFAASRRIDDLVARMTIQEKAGQLSCFSDEIRPFSPNINPGQRASSADAQLARVRKGEIGCIFNGIGVAAGRRIQDVATKETRLGIPVLLAADVIHGLRTIFPIPLGESASFDADLARRTARAAADEATAVGLHWTFAPMVDVARDQRWGRVAEGSGEDPYLGGILAKARVEGFQGKRLSDPRAMLACPKHFVGYGAVSGGMDYNFTDMSEATLREIHLAPFKAAFDAGAMSTMTAFNDIDGVPMTGNRELVTGVLRDEWRFRGIVVSDYTSEQEMVAHGYAADDANAARLAILAGVDIAMQSNLYNAHLPALVQSGAVPIAAVDAAVKRVLAIKEALGLFDDPYRSLDPRAERARVQTAAMTKLSREAGQRSIVLLRNEGDLLPLSRNPGRVALIGPCADVDVLGCWSFYGDDSKRVSIEAGVREVLGDRLTVVRGSDAEEPIAGGIGAAVAAARAADLVLLAVGESSVMSGEAQSRTDIGLPPPQLALAEAVLAAGKPVVVLLRHGRALALTDAVANAPAILACWFLGSEMGHAVADVLFGRASPSARLPVSFPLESGQQPYFYNNRTTGRPADPTKKFEDFRARYRSVRNEPRFAFGHGLTYTSFAASDLKVPAELAWNGSLEVSVRIANTGKRAGTELVQLYLRDRVASRTRPIRQLARFERVTLAPGEARTVRFTLTRGDLQFWGDLSPDADGGREGWLAEPGEFELRVAEHAMAPGLAARFKLLAA